MKGIVMKSYAHYDAEGAIHALIVGEAPAGFELRQVPQPGMHFGEVEGVKLSDPRDAEAIRKIAETHRVAVSAPRAAALVKKRK